MISRIYFKDDDAILFCTKKYGMTIQTCFEERNLSEYGFKIGECLSHTFAYKLTGKLYKNWSARK